MSSKLILPLVRRRVLAALVTGAVLLPGFAGADNHGEEAAPTPRRADFLDAAYMPGLGKVVVTGHYGLLGTVEVGDEGARLALLADVPPEDFTALEKISDTEVLIGSSTGRLYHFDGTTVTQIAELSEYEEPILDIAANDSNGVWVVGARGLVAKSSDGKEFEAVEIADVKLPKTEFPAGQPADWYLGVSNLDTDNLQFTATVNGEPAIDEEHYILYPDEGFIQIQTELDMEPPPSIEVVFQPGPPFRAGDVSWNVVLLGRDSVTLAGEFGMILQSYDNGETWIRRDTEIVPREPEPAYWMSGVQRGSQVWLAGAAGVSQHSTDGGETWVDNPKPGREGIFGITLTPDNKPIISGAVGLIGTMENDDWVLADRTRLKLLSWLKTPVLLPDGSVLVMGGRAAAIRYKDGEFNRVPVTM